MTTTMTMATGAKAGNLMDAAHQWAHRPDDERFESIEALRVAVNARREVSSERVVRADRVRFAGSEDEVLAIGPNGGAARFSHHAFEQACALSKAPAGYLRRLPAGLAAAALEHSWSSHAHDTQRKLLLTKDSQGENVIRGTTGEEYVRIWDSEIVERLGDLSAAGWRVPPARPARTGQRGTRPATADDVLAISSGGGVPVQVGDQIAPAGVYASAHDMFVFMVDPERVVDDGSELGLRRGFFLRSAEVGGISILLTEFLMRGVCGNHIVWGAAGVVKQRIFHVGAARERWGGLARDMATCAHESPLAIEGAIREAQRTKIGADRDEIARILLARKVSTLRDAVAAYTLADMHPEDGDPRTTWGMAQGLTRLSQASPYADERAQLDASAGRLLSMAF